MSDAVRVIDRIRDQADYSVSAPSDGLLQYSEVTGKFATVQEAVVAEVDQLAIPNTGDAGTDRLIESLRAWATGVSRVLIRTRQTAPYAGVHVVPGVGDDDNDGMTPDTPWESWDRIVAAVGDEILGAPIVDLDGVAAGIGTYGTPALKLAGAYEILAGRRIWTGTRIWADTTQAPLQITAPLTLPAGCTFRKATAALADLRVNLPLTTSWTTTAQTHVYASVDVGFTAGGFGPVLYEDVAGEWAQLKPIIAANVAAALPLLEADPGSCYADVVTGKVYIHAIGGTNPNSDGKDREYAPNLCAGVDGQLLDATGCVAFGLSISGGLRYNPITGAVQAQDSLSTTTWDDVTYWNNCVVSRYGKRATAALGAQSGGLLVARRVIATLGPGGIAAANWQAFLDYTSAGSNDGNVTVYVECGTEDGVSDVSAAGGSGSHDFTAMFADNNGSGNQFALRRLIDCDFDGLCNLGGAETSRVEAVGCVFGGSVASDVPETLIDRALINHRMPVMVSDDAEISNSLIVIGTTYSGDPSLLGGSLTLRGCTVDLTGGNDAGTAWENSGVNFTLTIQGCAWKARSNATNGLITGSIENDVVTVDRTATVATGAWLVFKDGFGADTTYTQVFGGSGSMLVSSLGVDADYGVLENSPLIGLPDSRPDVVDYSGVSFASRRTAGAYEADSAFNSPYEIVSITDSGGLPKVTTLANSNLTTGDTITIVRSGVFPALMDGTVSYDGPQTITTVNATSFTLDGQAFAGITLGGRWVP